MYPAKWRWVILVNFDSYSYLCCDCGDLLCVVHWFSWSVFDQKHDAWRWWQFVWWYVSVTSSSLLWWMLLWMEPVVVSRRWVITLPFSYLVQHVSLRLWTCFWYFGLWIRRMMSSCWWWMLCLLVVILALVPRVPNQHLSALVLTLDRPVSSSSILLRLWLRLSWWWLPCVRLHHLRRFVPRQHWWRQRLHGPLLILRLEYRQDYDKPRFIYIYLFVYIWFIV